MKQTIDQVYDAATLRRLQLVELDILKKFDAMCEKHGLQYFAAFGTALGQVRHTGIIPWDDDIDVGMMRKDYERLRELVPLEFGDGYTLLNGQTDPRYPFMTSRIMKKGTEFRMLSMKNAPYETGIFLDIFCFDWMPDDAAAFQKMKRNCWVLEKLCILRNMPFPNLPYRGLKRWIVYAMCAAGSVCVKIFPRAALHRWMQNAAQVAGEQPTGRIGCPFGLKPEERIYPTQVIFPQQKLPFEDMTISMPHDPHAMLRIVFGDDYMTPLPEGKRSSIVPYRLSFGDEASD